MLDYSSDIDSEILSASGECSFWLRGESCGATTCNECGADAAAALVANAAASLTGVVVAARQTVDDDDCHSVRARVMTAVVMRMQQQYHDKIAYLVAWQWWFHGLWEAAAGTDAGNVNRRYVIPYALGRIAFLAWRNAREENRRV